MARYETRSQILGLFLGAALISVVVIVGLRAEARKRFVSEVQPEEVQVTVEDSHVAQSKFNMLHFLSDVKQKIRGVFGAERKKRSTTTSSPTSETAPPKSNSALSESLLGEALAGHEIRNLEEKLDALQGDEDGDGGQIVQGILARFCEPKVEAAKLECEANTENLRANLASEYEETLKDFILEYDDAHQKVKVKTINKSKLKIRRYF